MSMRMGLRQRGFTLIELLITIAIMAILMAVAAPYLENATISGKLSSSANSLLASASLARGEAIKRNTATSLCMSSDGATCATTGGWEQGWIVTTTVSGTTTVLQHQQAAPAGFKITETGSSATTIAFPPIGLLASGYTFKVCRATPTVGSQERELKIGTTGRLYVQRTATGTCS